MDAQLKTLILERGQIKGKLTRLKTFVPKTSSPMANVRLRLRSHQATLLDTFDRIQDQIDLPIAGTDMEAAQSDEREQFTELYFSLMSDLETHLEPVTPDSKGDSAAIPPSRSATNPIASHLQYHLIQLPTIQLPSFDGNYNDWVKFRDTFVYFIHRNDSPSDIQKFHYLSGALRGPAARIIQALEISEANYRIAWETLRARYDNSSALRQHHLTSLLDLPPIQQHSQQSIREFIDETNSHLAALKSLGEPVEHWDSLIITILTRKLDQFILRDWERRSLAYTRQPVLRDLLDFLEERSQYLENIASNTWSNRRPDRPTAQVVNTVITCPVCAASHQLHQCNRFKKLNVAKRRETVRNLRLCFNCLTGGHMLRTCTRSHCKICHNKHHTLLHVNATRPEPDNTATNNPPQGNSISRPPNYIANTASESTPHTVLSTAIVVLRDCKGKKRECRALLDSGSQAHFITEDCCKRLGLKVTPTNATVAGIGKVINPIRGTAQIEISSKYNNFRSNISCLTIPTITADIPSVSLTRQELNISHPLQLADHHLHQRRCIDMLIGPGLIWNLLCVGQHRLDTYLILQKTQLGWVLGRQLAMDG